MTMQFLLLKQRIILIHTT